MNTCEFKYIKFKKGIFDTSLDATYILHLEGNGRLNNIKKQLEKIKPTKHVFIYYNKGFKKCKKNLPVANTTHDIIHSYIEIFKHSQKQKYNSIMILEDDYIIDRELNFNENISNINTFISNNHHKEFMLSIGCIPILYYPSFQDHVYISRLSFATHNMVYSKKYQENIIKNEKTVYKYGDWDMYTNTCLNKYIYKTPYIYQKFGNTENQRNLYHCFGIKYIILKYLDIMKFQKNQKNAFNTHYWFSFIFSVSFAIVCFYIIYILLIKYLYNIS